LCGGGNLKPRGVKGERRMAVSVLVIPSRDEWVPGRSSSSCLVDRGMSIVSRVSIARWSVVDGPCIQGRISTEMHIQSNGPK